MSVVRYVDFIDGVGPQNARLFEHISRYLDLKMEPMDILSTVSGPGKLEAACLTFRSGAAEFGRL
jgi:hypothetical protein